MEYDKRGSFPNTNEYYSYEENTDHTRIVNGYEPLERPWMALLLLSQKTEMCGGSLINEMLVSNLKFLKFYDRSNQIIIFA